MEHDKRPQAPRGGGHAERHPRKRRGSPARTAAGIVGRVFFALFTVALIGVLTAGIFAYIFLQYINTTVAPNLTVSMDDYELDLSSFIYYQDKETGEWVEYQTIHGVEDRILVTYDQIPDAMWQAAVAIEDHRFFQHHGVDWYGTLGAVKTFLTGGDTRGASTITQQVLRNITKDKEVTINRKIREIIRALQFEKNTTKEQILTRYLNTIYLGKGCYGVQTAAQYYFGKDVWDLTTAECASIIAITNNPEIYGPMSTITITREDGTTTTPREANKKRQGWVLDRMADEEVINPNTGKPYLTEEQRDQIKAEPLNFTDGSVKADELVAEATASAGRSGINNWFVDQVLLDVSKDLAEKYDIDKDAALDLMYRSGYRIYTTMDPEIQNIAEAVYADRSNLDVTSKKGQVIQSGITVMDPYTGNVVAIVGAMDPKEGNLVSNYATMKKQVGSSMKPLTAYAPALDAGVITPASTFDNYPVRLEGGSPWPKNSPNRYTGWTSVQEGIRRSINTIAVQSLESVGTVEAYAFATENLGLDLHPNDMAPSPLGMGGLTYGLSTVEMAAAYSCFVNKGIYNKPRTYTYVENSRGDVILENEPESHVAMKETTAYLMTKMLNMAATTGTGASASFSGMTIAGKTGTTNTACDRYFAGFSPYYCAAVWTGFQYAERISYNGNPAITMWKKVMQQIHEDLPNKSFEKPESGLTTVTVCADSGMKLTDACLADIRGSRAISFEIPAGLAPTEECTLHTMANYCIEGDCLAGALCPESSIVEKGVLNYEREDYGPSISAEDDAYLLVNIQKAAEEAGGCPFHGGNGMPYDPNAQDPNDPYDPNNPFDPNYQPPVEPVDPGTTTPDPGTTTPEPDVPQEPADPPATDPSVPGDGNWFDNLWNTPAA